MHEENKWLAVVNPSSANGRARDTWPHYWEKIRRAGIDLAYRYTSGQGDGTEIVRRALADGIKKFLAVGGDGTVNEVVNGLLREDKPAAEDIEFAVFGLGTGSDFSRLFPKVLVPEDLARLLNSGSSKMIDVGKVTFQNWQNKTESRYFLNVSNLGMGAEVVNAANRQRKVWGSGLTYFAKTMATLFHYKNIAAELWLDGQRRAGEFCGIMVCNGRFIGGGMKIAPQAELDDGLFDVVIIKNISVLKLLSRFHLIYKGKHIHLPEVEVFRCREIKISTAETVLLEIDGEIPGVSPSAYSSLPQCLRLKI